MPDPSSGATRVRRVAHAAAALAVLLAACASVRAARLDAPWSARARHLTGSRVSHQPDDSASGVSITINVPAFRLDVRDGDSTWSYPVAVGLPRYPTPRGAFRIREVVWNPRWEPPASDWARDERPQGPGPDNPMGRVKLRFTGLVFVHGTPLVRSLGSAASHACVRMANADAIAIARLVHRRALPALAAALVDSVLADSTRTRTFAPTRAVPVVVRYDVAEVRRDTLWIHPDVYRLRRSIRGDAMAALLRAGVDTGRVDRAALAALVVAGRRRAASVPLATLVGAATRW